MRNLPALTVISLATILLAWFAWYLDNLQPIATPVVMDEHGRSLLAGESIEIPSQPGWWHVKHKQADLLSVVASKKINQQEINLCEQSAGSPGHSPIIPLKIGYSWQAVTEVVKPRLASGEPAHYELRNLLLDSGPQGIDIPAMEINGEPLSGFPTIPSVLRLKLNSSARQVVVSDSEPRGVVVAKRRAGSTEVDFVRDAWVIWGGDEKAGKDRRYFGAAALRIQRLNFQYCPLGILRVGLYHSDSYPPLVDEDRIWPAYLLPARSNENGGFHSVELPVGVHQVPQRQPPEAEDADLFKRIVKNGLIRVDANGYVHIAPKDLARVHGSAPEMMVNSIDAGLWQGVELDKVSEETLGDLHGPLVGRYVRRQIARFNNGRYLASVRARRANKPARRLLEAGGIEWSAQLSEDQHLSLYEAMPLRAGALFERTPKQWDAWQSVRSWPVGYKPGAVVKYTMRLPKSARGTERFELMVVGSQIRVKGAVVIKVEPRCISKACSSDNVTAQKILIDLNQGRDQVEIELVPRLRGDLAPLLKGEFQHILWQNGELAWRKEPFGQANGDWSNIKVIDRNGRMLFENRVPTTATIDSGLVALVGMNTGHSSSIAGILARLSDRGRQMEAKLTIDFGMQRKAQKALDEGVERVSSAFATGDAFRHTRTAGLLVMDAETGEILAMAGSPAVSPSAQWGDLAGFDAVHTSQSPLRLPAIQHSADNHSLAGSTFKLVTSLYLEQLAAVDPELDELLSGVSLSALNRQGMADGYSFEADAGCYPARAKHSINCRWGEQIRYRDEFTPVINNYGSGGDDYERPGREMARHKDRRYGLEQALRDSMNTWFAWLFETRDGTLLGRGDIPGLPHSRALAPDALDRVRPIEGLMGRLGFTKPLDLSAGLLPDQYPWRTWDVLRSTASYVDPIADRHNLRQMAIGLRTHTTLLNMALVSAAIATGQRVQPRLLVSLNGETVAKKPTEALGIYTGRIQAGMKRVPVDGTAKQAFASQALAEIRNHLYVKTGTAPVRVKKPHRNGQVYKVNTAWLTGWLAQGALPNQSKPLAIACMVNHAHTTGGKVCGPIVAAFLNALKEQGSERSKDEGLMVRELSL